MTHPPSTSQPTPLPPDRSKIATEARNPRTMDLQRLSAAECVALIAQEDLAVHQAIQTAAPSITAFVEDLVPRFLAGGRLIYVGAGTSGRLGVLDASEAPPTFQLEPGRIIGIIAGGDSALRRSSEGMEDDPEGARAELEALGLHEHDCVLGIAAGGTTPYPLGALSIARQLAPKSMTGLLTCAQIPHPPAATHVIHLPTGPEVLTGSTRMKAGTATKLALNIISTTLMIQTGRVYENLMVDLRATNDKLLDRAARIVSTLTGLDRAGSIELLDRAGKSAKVAIVMHRLELGREEAQRRLAAASGRLQLLLGTDQIGR